MFLFKSRPTKAVIDFYIFQPVAFFNGGVGFDQPCAVICESEKVLFFWEANRVDWSH